MAGLPQRGGHGTFSLQTNASTESAPLKNLDLLLKTRGSQTRARGLSVGARTQRHSAAISADRHLPVLETGTRDNHHWHIVGAVRLAYRQGRRADQDDPLSTFILHASSKL